MTAKKAAAKKAAAPKPDDTPDVSEVRISTKWDSEVDDVTDIRRYTFGDGTTGKAWRNDDGTWNVAIAGVDGRIHSSGMGTHLSVEDANIMLETAGSKAEANLAKRAAVSD